MDLKAQKAKREARLRAKKEAIEAQLASIAPTEAEAVLETPETETKEDSK